MDKKILVLSPNLDLHGGNLVTLARIRDHLVSHGFSCELSSPMAFPDQETFNHKVDAEDIRMLIGIHAYKTGVFMKESGLPFILIIGGTDINVMAEDCDKLREMSQVVMDARFVICFSSDLMKKVKTLWPQIDNNQLKVIPQGIEIHQMTEKINNSIIRRCLQLTYNNNNSKLPRHFRDDVGDLKPIIFTLIAGIRAVKNPAYLVKTFQDWHGKNDSIFLLIVGHVLDKSYTEKEFLPVIHSKPGVLFIPGVSSSEAHAVIKESFALVNSSDSEGMCLALLEAILAAGPDDLARHLILVVLRTGGLAACPLALAPAPVPVPVPALNEKRIGEFSCVGGDSVHDITCRVLESVLSHELQLVTNWIGANDKLKFQGSAFHVILPKIVRANLCGKAATDVEVGKAARSYLSPLKAD